MKRIYILPNLITTANIVCGVLSMIAAMNGEFQKAVWFVVISGICDSLDGRVARMAKATSAFGVQFDSLSDLTSFGIAPAILLYNFGLKDVGQFGVGVTVFYVACAALRLARFNVSVDEKNESAIKKIRKGYFQGLPSPAAAGLVVSSVLFQSEFEFLSSDWVHPFILTIGTLFGALMVSNVPFPSFKELNWRSKGRAWILLIPVLVILFLIQAPAVTLFSVGYSYLVLSLIWSAYMCLIRDRRMNRGSEPNVA